MSLLRLSRRRLLTRALPLPPLVVLLSLLAGCGDDGDDIQAPPVDVGSPAEAGCREGTLPSGALYQVCFPERWNGDLVLWAHGYVSPYEPLALPDDAIGGQPLSRVVTALGYAFATTSYRANGLVVPEAVSDLVELTAQVRAIVLPDPERTYAIGASEGGLVAALTLEEHEDELSGVLELCGPVGDFGHQLDYLGDFRVVFDYFYPGVLPGTVVDVPADARTRWASELVPAIAAALAADPVRAAELLSVTGAPIEEEDPSTVEATVVGVLWYSIFATPDAITRLGGNPYGNVGREYAGSSDDAALNRGVGRFEAAPEAVAAVSSHFQTTGRITKPLVMLHTIGDPIVRVDQQREYEAKLDAEGADELTSAAEISRYGHCSFTGPELVAAFGALVAKVTGAVPDVARAALPWDAPGRPGAFGPLGVPTAIAADRATLRIGGP